ncbi:S-ribosylhomocysteine lyase [Hominenteromicrobium mulieris]|uniref:S-ribosylhomocysteine lyase n=1 Tax=Hominenteromicrobium mulieris TaxID=2885357 RepID=UPI00376F116F
MYLLSYIRGDFVYCPVLLVLFSCRTGFYFLLRDNVSRLDALHLVQESFAFIRDFEGEIPGSRREECGNYKEHDLKGAKETAVDMLEVLKDWTPEKMEYEV